MQLKLRRLITSAETRYVEAGQPAKLPLLRVAVTAVIENPYVDRYVADLAPLVEASRELGEQMAQQAVKLMGSTPVQSYGKAGLVGVRGEQEHANALLTTAFADPFRALIGGAAWISSVTKVGAAGALIDVPLNCIDDVYVRSHYDAISLCLPDTPMPDEIALIFCMASGGRLNARVGGMGYAEAHRAASSSR
jgi:amino acid synthesis protein